MASHSQRNRSSPLVPRGGGPKRHSEPENSLSPGSSTSSSRHLQPLEGSWQLVGKTERQDECGRLQFGAEEATLQYGSTILYLNSHPVSCEQTNGQMKYSFEVIDTCSSNSDLSDDAASGDICNYGDADFNSGDDSPGTFDLYLTADGHVEGEASAAITSGADDLCFKFKGWRANEEQAESRNVNSQ